MRIVGGMWRGRVIESPAGRGATRPTTDRTRESIASMVLSACALSLEGVRVLDAFAGSGALGLELLSRGATSCTFVDARRSAVECVRRNIALLGASPNDAVVVCGDVFRLAQGTIPGSPFDVIVLDPPYATAADDVGRLLATLIGGHLVCSGAVVVYERSAEARPIGGPGASHIIHVRTKCHGGTACDLLRIGGVHD